MLKQYDFTFSADGAEKVYSEMAVKIHGALMYLIPESYKLSHTSVSIKA